MKDVSSQRGASLIEVAITTLLLATCLLSLATLQKRSLQFNQSAFMRSQANIQAYDILDRIRINRGDVSENVKHYNAAYNANPSGNTLAVADVAAWRANLVRVLPGGKGSINCNETTKICVVSIKWSEEQIFGTASTTNTEGESELVYRSRL